MLCVCWRGGVHVDVCTCACKYSSHWTWSLLIWADGAANQSGVHQPARPLLQCWHYKPHRCTGLLCWCWTSELGLFPQPLVDRSKSKIYFLNLLTFVLLIWSPSCRALWRAHNNIQMRKMNRKDDSTWGGGTNISPNVSSLLQEIVTKQTQLLKFSAAKDSLSHFSLSLSHLLFSPPSLQYLIHISHAKL